MKFKLFLMALGLLMISCSTSDDSTTQITNPDNTNNGNNNSGNFEVAFQGNFMNSAHETSGVVKVNTDNTILRLENFSSDDGPSLELYLTTDLSAETYISLGALQGLNGNFDYTLPNDNIDFSVYKYIIVWCVPFSVNFGYAELEM